MKPFLPLGITLSVAFLLGGCAGGDTKLTNGAAAGAGIGALLGGGNSAESETSEAEPIVEEGGIRYFGPAR